MPLYLDTGRQNVRSARSEDDPCLITIPDSEHDVIVHGVIMAVAENTPDAGNEATTSDAVRILSDAFFATPENWGLKHALQESAVAANNMLFRKRDDLNPPVAMTAVVLRRRRWALVHAGHTRAWLMRNNELKLLTRDHIEPRLQRAPRVLKACGLAAQLDAQFLSGELRENDVLVLTTPGVHDTLSGTEILSCLVTDGSAKQMAAAILDRTGRRSPAATCVIRIEQLPEESQSDIEEDIAVLPAIAPPDVGEEIDGFRIERLVHKSSRYRLYKALDTSSGQTVALKFPNPRDADEPGFAEHFLREEWIGRRVASAYLLRTLALRKGRRTALYSVMAYPSGESLARKLGRKGTLGVRESVFIGTQLLEALTELHNQSIVHNDIRPQNILLEKNAGHLLLLGLGSSHVTQTSTRGQESETNGHKRGSFLAPELFERNTEPTVRSDIFAAGTTIYRMLTGSYPYGKIASNGHAPHGEYSSIVPYRADATAALDAVLRRACALDPLERFDNASDFSEALENGLHATATPSATSRRKQAKNWNWEIAAIAVVLIALFTYLALVLRR